LYTTPAIDEPHFDLDVTLGLFDGISCGQEALKRAGITTRIYLASEIEKYPMIITRKNHPLTVQLGDVRDVKGENLPKVDLILGGSPCQGFSFAGKQLNFDDPRSALFFEFVRVLEECREFNPDVKFLLENVRMKKEFKDIITEHLGVEPVMINSSLVSAQNRKRLYWTNIPGVGQPEDKGILLKDVLEDGIASNEMTTKGKSYCLTARYSGAVAWNSIEKKQRTMVKTEPTCGRIVGRKINPETGKRDDYNPNLKIEQRLEPRLDEKTGTLTTVQKDNVVVDGPTYRKLTPIECERLQTLPDNYTEGVSNTQRYKALGNGWTVDVIVHLLQGLKWQS